MKDAFERAAQQFEDRVEFLEARSADESTRIDDALVTARLAIVLAGLAVIVAVLTAVGG
jgi:hypothetical protein